MVYKVVTLKSILVWLQFYMNVIASIPENISPTSVYSRKNTSIYPAFIGEGTNTNVSLQHVQGVTKIGDFFFIFAKDHIFTIDMREVNQTQFHFSHVFDWASTKDSKNLCLKKGMPSEKCHNYIKMIAMVQTINGNSKKLVTCATESFQPMCKYLKMDEEGNLTDLGESFRGTLTCPYDPTRSYASLLLPDGHWYTATEAAFGGHDAVLHRSSLMNGNEVRLRTEQSQSSLFKDPEYISLIEASHHLNKIYVLFKETATEDKSYQTYTRIGQVCKGDVGGQSVLRNKFTSFFKVRLNCSLPGQPPFYFNEASDSSGLVAVHTSNGSKNVFFVVMNTPRNSVPASALCVFSEDSIEKALTGNYMEKYTDSNYITYWGEQTQYPKPHPAHCRNPPVPRSDMDLTFIRKHPLMHDNVNAWNLKSNHGGSHDALPLFTRMTEKNFLTTLAVDVLTDRRKTVVVMGTEDGKIIKVVIDQHQKVNVVEEREVFNEEKCHQQSRSIQKIVIDKESGNMLVQFESCVVVAPLCPLHNTCVQRTCSAASDPYCSWNRNLQKCLYTHYLSTYSSFHYDTTPCKEDTAGAAVLEVHNPDEELVISDNHTETPTINPNITDVKPLGSTLPPKTLLASTSPMLVIILAIVIFFVGFVLGAVICFFRRKKKGEENFTLGKFKATANGGNHIAKESSDYNQQKVSRSRQPSGNRQSSGRDPRGSDYRGSRSDEEVFDKSELPVIDQPTNHRQKKMMSTSSSQGGRQATRASKHSTGSNGVEHAEQQESPTQQDFYDAQFVRQLSNGSGHSLEMTSPLENEAFAPSSPHKMSRVPPNRSTSFQAPPLYRTYSVDQPNTIGHPRQNRRPIARQHSLQVQRNPQQAMFNQPPIQMGQFPQQQTMPHPANGQGWMVQTPNRQKPNGKPFDQRQMTHSLDRRQLQKGQNQYMKEGQMMVPTTPTGYSIPHHRKRYVSEPGKSAISQSHMQMSQPTQYQSIQEEQEPFIPSNSAADSEKMRREHLSLNVLPVYEQDPNAAAQNLVKTAPAMIQDQLEPLFTIPGVRQYPGRYPTHSNPGTPMREAPPQMFEDMNGDQYKRHTTLPNKPKPKIIPTQQMQQILNRETPQRPQVLNLNQNNSLQPVLQSKSSPAVTPSDGRPAFPNTQRNRHSSGKTQLTPSSPVKSIVPINFTTNNNQNNGNGHVGLKARKPSGEKQHQ